MNKEIEIRFRVNAADKQFIIDALKELNWTPTLTDQIDRYYCAKKYATEKRTRECPYIVRIRVTGETKELAYKSFQGSIGSWIEIETEISDVEAMRSILEHLDQTEYLKINKDRLSGKVGEIEINIDAIEGLGDFVEMEAIGEDEMVIRENLIRFGEKIGLKTADVIQTGYVQLMEEKNFDS